MFCGLGMAQPLLSKRGAGEVARDRLGSKIVELDVFGFYAQGIEG